VVSYEVLLDLFWDSHIPPPKVLIGQYRPAVFYHSEEQRRLAEASFVRVAAKLGRDIYTEILPVDDFFPAEDYHQKFVLRQNDEFADELLALYPDPVAFRDSTVALRLNSFLGGHGTLTLLDNEIAGYGLSDNAQQHLRELVSTGAPAPGCVI
jgi:peptide-methionine (S)-S-oxide reductase